MSDAERAGQTPMTEEQILAGLEAAQLELASEDEETADKALDLIVALRIAGREIGMTFESDKKDEPQTEEQTGQTPQAERKTWVFDSYKGTDYSAGRTWE